MLPKQTLALGYVLLVAATPHAFGQTPNEVYGFQGGADGSAPYSGLVGGQGLLYGATWKDGPNTNGCEGGCGTIFSFSPLTGTEKVIAGGTAAVQGINTGLLLNKGVLYGTVAGNATAPNGLVFSVDPNTGALAVVYTFKKRADGETPAGPLIANGNLLYGSTAQGGASERGTVFSLDPATGTKKIIYSFKGGADGQAPVGPLAYDKGTLYGTTVAYKSGDTETIFAVDVASGTETVLYTFPYHYKIPQFPLNGVILSKGTLYGTTKYGEGYWGSVFSFNLSSNTETDLYEFEAGMDGKYPSGPMIIKNGNLYGETWQGGNEDHGVVFQVNAVTGAESVLARIDPAVQESPNGVLALFKGELYGTHTFLGSSNNGGIFAVKP